MAKLKLKERDDETPEQKRQRYVEIGYRIAQGRKQNANATEDDLQVEAIRYADTRIANDNKKQQASFEEQIKKITRSTADDGKFREDQYRAYHDAFEWNKANDEATLQHLIDLEVQIRQINRELQEEPKNVQDKVKLRGGLANISREHRLLQEALGIDRPSRERKSSSGTPMDDWNRIKEQAGLKKRMQMQEFIEAVNAVKTEPELRDKLKYGVISLGGFDTIDAILVNHRRVLGLSTELEKH